MNEPKRQYDFPRPIFTLRESGWWFTATGTLATLFLLIIPSILDAPLAARILVGLVIFVAPLFILIAIYLYRILIYFKKRITLFDRLYQDYLELNDQTVRMTEAINALMPVTDKHRILRPKSIQFYRGDVYSIFEANQDTSLSKGQRVDMMDSDGFFLGTFRIVNIEGETCWAKVNGYIDSLWLGYIHKTGESQTHPLPGSLGILYLEDSINNE